MYTVMVQVRPRTRLKLSGKQQSPHLEKVIFVAGGITTRLHVGWSGDRILIGARDFSPKLSSLALGPTQPPVKWVPGFFLWFKAAGALHIPPRLRMSGDIPVLPNLLSCFGQGQL
jgi:hypothetical protein